MVGASGISLRFRTLATVYAMQIMPVGPAEPDVAATAPSTPDLSGARRSVHHTLSSPRDLPPDRPAVELSRIPVNENNRVDLHNWRASPIRGFICYWTTLTAGFEYSLSTPDVLNDVATNS
jgi:hypothetical protein